MSDELVFYTHPMSRARLVRWMLEEVGQPYETKILEFGHSMRSPEYLAINPMGKVPAIRHGETVVTESPPSAPIWPTPSRPQDLPRLRARASAAPIIAGCSSLRTASSRR